jgi:outer membrane receptor protein involved in Fe transport
MSFWNSVNLSNVDKVEVIRGPVSAEFGNFGFGGMLAMYSDRSDYGDMLDLSLTYGSENAFASSGGLRYENRDLQTSIRVSGKSSDGWRRHSRFNSENIDIGLSNRDLQKYLLKWNLNLSHSFEEEPGAVTAEELSRDRESAARDMYGNDRLDNTDCYGLNTSLLLEVPLKEDHTLKSVLSFNLFDTDRVTTVTKPVDENPRELNLGLDISTLSDLRFLGVDHKLTLGVDFDYGHLKSIYKTYDTQDELASGSGHLMSSAFFAKIITSLSSRLRFSGGIRFDNLSYRYERDRVLSSEYEAEHQQDHTAISPKVGLNYEAVKNLSVYASVAGAFKAPTLAHMYESPPIYFEMPEFAGYFQISNADLEPQEGVCYETGLKYQNTVGTSADVAIYYYDIKNEIDFDPVQQKYLNIGESIHSGVELTLSQRIVEELYLSGQIDYISSEFEGGDFDGNQINGIPKYNYSLALDYRSEKLYRLRMEARGRGQQYIDQANSEELEI